MQTGATIVALATARPPAPRAAIRLSGEATRALLDAHLHDPPARPGPHPCRLRLDHARDLPALVLRFDAPRSYTGEDAAEIQIPGNPHLVERVIDLLTSGGQARRAGPGEFTARAYLNERLGLAEAEGVAQRIAASNSRELEAANRLLAGEVSERYSTWADELTTLLALVEAGIDFTDQEDVVAIEPAELRARLASIRAGIAREIGNAGARRAESARPRVALIGPPNAGKSTLFNALLARRRAVATDQPHTTRDALIEPLDLSPEHPGAAPADLMDLPGLEAPDQAAPLDKPTSAARSAALETLDSADVLIHCDPAGRFQPIGGTPLDSDASRPVIRVRTKGDLAGAARSSSPDAADLPICALDGWNLGPLRRAILDAVGSARAAADAALVPRHRRALADADDRLAEAIDTDDPELIAESLRRALDAIGELIGRVSADDVIGRVFSTFCVGK